MARTAKQRRRFIARPREFRLLVFAICIVCAFFLSAALSVQDAFRSEDLLLPATFIVVAFIAHGLLIASGSKADMTLLPLWTVLTGIGMSYHYRLGSFTVDSWDSLSCLSFGVAPLILVTTAILFGNGRLKYLSKSPGLWILAAFGIGIAVLATGVTFRGSVFGPGKTTPTEFLKPLLIIGLSGLLVNHGRHIERGSRFFTAESRRTHIIVIGAWLMPGVTLICLRDLGMLAATALLLGILMTLATRRIAYPLIGIAGITAIGYLAQHTIHKAGLRISAWMNPFEAPDTYGFQIIRSLFAVFNGELFGRGVGNGLPRSIPLVETDFVYASIAEEFGWLGSMMILMIVFLIIRRSLQTAESCKDAFTRLVCYGCGAMWLIQCVLHVGGVIKLIPMTGVPFPGLSTGGSALMVFAVLTGWIMAAD
ncbi:MAG: FtsW/RodA/SpoVE family cell cycle protein [bacterium]